jgi:hypothetical protein
MGEFDLPGPVQVQDRDWSAAREGRVETQPAAINSIGTLRPTA